MSKSKILVASGIFILITAVKLAFPSLAADIKDVIIPVIGRHDDYRTAMAEVGEMITGEQGVISVLGRIYDKVIPASGTVHNSDSAAALSKTNHLQIETMSEVRARYSNLLPDDASAKLSESNKPYTEPIAAEAPAETNAEAETEFTEPESPAAEAEAIEQSEPIPAEITYDAETSSSSPELPGELPSGNASAEYTEPISAVQAFSEEQSGYTDKAIPANVLLDMPELPFDYGVPVTGYNSSGFGYRVHPIEEEVKFHFGTDFGANTGTEILSFAGGYVLIADETDSYGKYAVIDHGNGYSSLYGHCSELLVSSGDYVELSQLIARVGETGQATGPHLHFELLKNGRYLNPEFYF